MSFHVDCSSNTVGSHLAELQWMADSRKHPSCTDPRGIVVHNAASYAGGPGDRLSSVPSSIYRDSALKSSTTAPSHIISNSSFTSMTQFEEPRNITQESIHYIGQLALLLCICGGSGSNLDLYNGYREGFREFPESRQVPLTSKSFPTHHLQLIYY